MCTGIEPWIIGAAASAAGSGAQLINQQNALKRQDRETARGITARAGLQREAGARVQQQINDVAASNPDADRKTQNDAFIAALRNAKVNNGAMDIGGPAGASDRFAADVGQARTAATGEGQALSGQLAAIDAPGLQRQREARGFTDAAIDLNQIGDRAKGLDFLTQLRTANAGRTNPLVDAAGSGLSAFGQTYAGREKKPKKPPGTWADQAQNAGVS
jgi:hypothetical protein